MDGRSQPGPTYLLSSVMKDWQKRWISASDARDGSKLLPPAAPPMRAPVSAFPKLASKAMALMRSDVTWGPKWRPPS